MLRHNFDTRRYRRIGPSPSPTACSATTMIYVDDDPRERERLMLLVSGEPTTLDLDHEAE